MTSVPSPPELKIDDLAEVLQLLRRHGYSGAKCYDLGLYLGLSPTTLNVIMLNHKGDIESCLRECLVKWLEKADKVQETKGGPTIYSLVSALRRLGMNRVADGVDMKKHPACKILARHTSHRSLVTALPLLAALLYMEKFIKEEMLTITIQGEALLIQIKEAVCNDCFKLEVLAGILCKYTYTAEIGNAIMREYRNVFSSDDLIDNDKVLKIYLPMSVTSEFKTMRLKLADAFFEVGSIMMSNPKCTIGYLTYVLRQYNKALRPQLDQCQNVHDILALVCDSCPLDDIGVLEHFVNKLKIEEAKPVIEEYKEAVEELKESKLSQCLNEKVSYTSPLQCERITIVVDKDSYELTLKDIERLSSAVFEKLTKHVKLNVVREGNSFTITCSFSLILSEQLISAARDNIDVLRANKVKRLTIGYCTVYEVNEIDDTSTLRIESDEQQFPLSSPNSTGLLKQLMVSLSVQLIYSKDEVIKEDSMALMKEAESLQEVLDTKIKMMNENVAESDELKEEYEELNKIKEIFKEQLVLFQFEKEEQEVAVTKELTDTKNLTEQQQEQKEDIKHVQSEEADKIPAYKVKEFFDGITEKLPFIASSFNERVTETKVLVDEATNGLEVVREYKEVREVPQVKESYRSLSNSTKAVHTYLDKVNGLYRTLKDQTPAVIKDIESGDVRSTEELAAEIDEIVKYCRGDYTTLIECFEKFGTSIDEAQVELKRLQEEAKSKRNKALAIAGGAAVASLFFGFVTFGAGAPAAAAATGATAVAAGAALGFVLAYSAALASIRKIGSKRFQTHQYSQIQDRLNEITSSINENTKIKRMTLDERTDLAIKMRSTLAESINLYNETSRGLRIAERVKINFANQVDSTF